MFTLTATPSGYTLNANPKVFNTSGRRTFFTDQNMIYSPKLVRRTCQRQ